MTNTQFRLIGDNPYAGLAPVTRDKSQGNWYPANGGTENEFRSRSGARLLYVWQPSSGRHAYINLDTDIILTDSEAQVAMEKW